MTRHADVVVVGGGPAGCAAAITAAERGMRVRLAERARFPRHRPGETLHPGAAPVLAQLGVEEAVAAASGVRHAAQAVTWAGRSEVSGFGGEGWRGYQIDRATLDGILLERARDLGARIEQPVAARAPVVDGARVIGVESGDAALTARFVVDAGGGRGWLRRRLGLAVATASPPLRAWYGYCRDDDDGDVPTLRGDTSGWTWTAPVAPGRTHWTRMAFAGGERPTAPPEPLARLEPVGPVRGADVTWRQVRASAGPGWFLCGDAACVLDPAASHGVLRALMSGVMAAHAIARVLAGSLGEDEAAAGYRAWIGDWFARDVRRLSTLYREQGAPWPARR